jgi:uncharacterized protein (DUF1810 family)
MQHGKGPPQHFRDLGVPVANLLEFLMEIANSLNLDRFLAAQAPVYPQVVAELHEGQKQSHWMWFIFPQMARLGSSPMARRYAIGSLKEANAYVQHPLLGQRLTECTRLMLGHAHLSAHDILGSPDDLKFRSSMTLFEAATEKGSPFQRALEVFYDGERDQRTIALLR